MQQHKCVEDYLESVVPKNIADSKRTELRTEMESHIYDKAEFYIEIGYDEETAFNKAVEEMGEADEVKTEFESIYKDSAVKGVLWFVGLCTINLLSVSNFGLGYWYFVEPSAHHFPSIAELTCFLAGFVFLITCIIKCCRYKLHKQLTGIVSALGLISLGSVITSGLFYPVLNAAYLAVCYITNSPYPEKDLAMPVNIVFLFLLTFVTFTSLNRDYRFREKTYRLPMKAIAIILSTVSVCFLWVYKSAYIKYEYRYLDKEYYEELENDNECLSDFTVEPFKVYNCVKIGDDVNRTQKLLKEKGFSDKNSVYEDYVVSDELHGFLDEVFPPEEREEGIEKYITTSNVFSYNIEGELMQRISKNVGENKYFAYYYTIPYGEEESWDDIVSCIFISFDSEGKIDYKLFLPDIEDNISDSYYYSTHLGEDTKKWFEKLRKGDSEGCSMKFFKNTDAYIIEDEKKNGESTVRTYRVYLDCYYDLEPSVFDFLLGYPVESVSYSYEFDIAAENGKINSGKMIYYDNPHDEESSVKNLED